VDSLTQQVRGLAERRICFVCHAPILPGDVIDHMDLRILTHHTECMEIAAAARRSFDRSRRGRWRSRAEVLRAIAGAGILLRELEVLEAAP
jgi:hypothetical protein